jgi:hypothetical protein
MMAYLWTLAVLQWINLRYLYRFVLAGIVQRTLKPIRLWWTLVWVCCSPELTVRGRNHGR